jgi:hypothetical protein
MKAGLRSIVPLVVLAAGTAAFAPAGDRYWSPTGLVEVQDLAVCGTTAYAATLSGLYRFNGTPDEWELVLAGQVSRVACDGDTVLFVAGAPYDGPVYVSHDAMDTVTQTTGLDSILYLGIEDLAVAGDQALAAVDNGVLRSTDGGSSFSIYSVLWDSSADYEIKAVWTDGTACAAGSQRGGISGIWYSATCERDTFTLVSTLGGQGWLDGSGSSVVAGSYFTDEYSGTEGFVSDDGGATWDQLPYSWDGIDTDFHRPFISGSIVMSYNSYSIFDFDLDDFVGYIDGLFLFDRTSGDAADMAAGFPESQQIVLNAIIETPDPILLVAEAIDVWEPLAPAELWWYRIPGGWPTGGFDFMPPSPGTLTVSPSLISSAGSASTTASLSASGASWMYLSRELWQISATIGPGWLSAYGWGQALGSVDGWQAYASSAQVPLGSATGFFYVDAWFEDSNGNMSDPSVWDAVAVVPATVSLDEGRCWAGWIPAEAGQTYTFGAAQSGGGGDIDVLHAEPGSQYWSNWSMYIGVNDSLTFTAQASGDHQIYICNYPEGLGTYSGGLVATVGGSKALGANKNGQRAAPDVPAVSVSHDAMPFHSLVAALEIFDDGFESGDPSAWSSY